MIHFLLRLLPILCIYIFSIPARAQISITTGLNADQLAIDVFQGAGVTISNATMIGNGQGAMASIGSYSAMNEPLVPDNGILLSTGNLTGLDVPASNFHSTDNGQSASDLDLAQLTGIVVYDVVALEFDFVPSEDLLVFDFVFASEEYPEYVCYVFNDGFGFFLSGPGISGPFINNAENIALLPGSSIPITINNVNNGNVLEPNCPPANEPYYVDNSAGLSLVFDGMTTIIPIQATVVPGQTYHIKLVIGDAGDSVFDSCLFLKAGSFRSVSSISTGIRAVEDSAMKAWFDPNGRLQISGDSPIGNVELLDVRGRVVHRGTYNSSAATISTEALIEGVYVLRSAQRSVRVLK